MDFRQYQSRLSRLSSRFNLMVALVFGLLVTNVILALALSYAFFHKKIEITPFSGNGGYVKSEAVVDDNYLSLMSKNFIYSRLNVTPQTVSSNHQLLLSYVDASSYPMLLQQFHQEEAVIKDKKISSVFDITGIWVNQKALKAKITGNFRRFVGLKMLKEEKITYEITYRYRLGRLTICKFVPVKEKAHA